MRYVGVICGALAAILCLSLASNRAVAQGVVFVNQSATGSNSGKSWSDAYIHLQDALAGVQSGNEVWVAYGIYRPDQGEGVVSGNRDTSFVLPSGVSLFGGFSGIESSREERNFLVYESILSGDLLGNDAGSLRLDNPLRLDNSYRVVQVLTRTDEIQLDGFTISGGMADIPKRWSGSAIRVDYQGLVGPGPPFGINNCLITRNVAARGTVQVSNAPNTDFPVVVISNSTIRDNWASTGAGVESTATILLQNVDIIENVGLQGSALVASLGTLYVEGSTIAYNVANRWGAVMISGERDALLVMWNSAVIGNTSLEFGTGGVSLDEASMVSINNVFSGNRSPQLGGAMDIGASRAWIINNVFVHNSAALYGGAISSVASNIKISNSIFWKNSAPSEPEFVSQSIDTLAVSHSLVQGELPAGAVDGGGILTGDPLFLDADGADNVAGSLDDDFRLTFGSPAIDSGINDSLYQDVLDVDGDSNFDEPWPADYLGNIRMFDGGSGQANVDMGVFEFDAPPVGTFNFSWPESTLLPESGLAVFPNPAVTNFTITWNMPPVPDALLQMYDISGRHIQTIYRGLLTSRDQIHSVISDFSPGIYLLRERRTGVSAHFIIIR